MAGLGPGLGAPGGAPPGAMPPSAGPAGPGAPPPPGMGGPPPPPPPAPVGGPSPASPTPFTDLSDKLPHHYQLLDVAASTIEQAINTGGFYKEPKVLAGVREVHSQLSTLIANGAKGGTGGSTPEAPATVPSAGTEGPDLDDDTIDEDTAEGG